MQAAVLTVSDLGSRGEREDTAGPAVVALLEGAGFAVAERALLPDEPDQIADQLRGWADGGAIELALTVGGTGLSPRDRTPEATEAVIDYRVDGLVQGMRAAGLVNLPGSERGATENLQAVLPVLAHAVEQLRDGGGH